MLLKIKKNPGATLDVKEVKVGASLEANEGMWLWKIKKAVHEYPALIDKREKLQKRLIQVSGRDYEQEIAVMQRLEDVEQLIEAIRDAFLGDEILTPREASILDHRLDGETLKEIGEFFSLSKECVRQILSKAYKKISDAAKAKYLE